MPDRTERRLDPQAILIAVIATIPPTAASVAAIVISLHTSEKVQEVKAVVAETAEKVEIVHKATNSLTDKLVASTRSDALQEGHTKGVRDQRGSEAKVQADKKKAAALPFWQRP